MKIEITQRDFIIILLIVVGLAFVLEANVSLKSHITFGDEGFHAGWGKWISQNIEYPQWDQLGFTDVFKTSFSRPPLFHLTEAGFLLLLGQQEIILKLLPPLIAALTILAFYILIKRLYNKEIALISSLILIGLPSFVTYTVVVFDEILFSFYMTLFTFTFILALKENNRRLWFLSAVFGALAVLTKNAGIIVFAFAGIAFLYKIYKERKLIDHLKQFALFFVIVSLIAAPFFMRNLVFYYTPTCYPIPLLTFDKSGCEVKEFEDQREFDVRTLSGGSENDILSFGILNYIEFAYGNYWFILIGLLGGLIVIMKKMDDVMPFILIMLVLGLIILQQTTQRTEDAARQLVAWASLITIISAKYWNEIRSFLDRYLKYLGLIIVVLILFLNYQNVTSKLSAMESVKRFSPMFFEACDWVDENLDKDVKLMTFWGYRASYSCQRIISPGWADIRLNDNPEDIVKISEMHGITHFFIQKFSISQQPSRESYSVAFVRLLENNPDKFEKIYENGPPLNQCLQQGGCDGNIIYKVIY
ncbi:MAG: glycosyltransferase family 39 protein [Candidatus Aenigmarchaeota archaeon]|nr:glycosyltransferase family 39 protein [Candidatus Aenigmarchaeota archaeon]